MNLNTNPTGGRPRRRGVRSTMVAVLTLAAMVLGILALHTAAIGEETGGLVSVVAADAETTIAASAAAHDTPISPYVDAESRTLGDGFLVGCLIIGMACVTLLILASLVLLARRPAVYRRLLDAGGFVVDSIRSSPLHLRRPSLTLLCISRV